VYPVDFDSANQETTNKILTKTLDPNDAVKEFGAICSYFFPTSYRTLVGKYLTMARMIKYCGQEGFEQTLRSNIEVFKIIKQEK